METQKSIASWAADTFGIATPARCATRMNEEVAELLAHLTSPVTIPYEAAEECADILIVLYVLAERLGTDIHAGVERKMAINRARKWKLDGSGCGQHIEEDQ